MLSHVRSFAHENNHPVGNGYLTYVVESCLHVVQPDGLQVQNITYTNIRGTSATPTAVKFDCSENQPCSGISMSGIDLKSTSGEDAESECTNAHGSASPDVKPPACFN